MSASELLPPEPGQIVVVRGRPAVVIDVRPSGHRQDELLHCVDLDYLDEYIPQEETVLWERERRPELLGSLEFPNVGRTNPENPEKYAAFVDAQHWMNAADIVSPQAGGDAEHQRNVMSLTKCLPSRLNIEFILGRCDELITNKHGVLIEECALDTVALR